MLQNQADAFDAGDTLPPSLLPQIQSQASARFSRETIPSTFYFFLNTRMAPFNNPLAREAVNYAIDRRALVRLASGFLTPECYFLPERHRRPPDQRLPVREHGRRAGPREG